jgi:hypothetical protein
MTDLEGRGTRIHEEQAMDGGQAATPGKGTLAAGPATTPTPLERVQSACAARDLPRIAALNLELRQLMLTDPVNPPKEARDGLAFARCWTMDRIAEIRDRFAPQLQSAQSGARSGTDNTAGVEALEQQMDTECTPFLDVLMKGDPQYRYLHFDKTIEQKVFAAVRLHSARRGVDQIGHRGDAEDEARAHGGLAKGDDPKNPTSWCGVFAYAQAELGGGMDPYWKTFMHGEAGIRGALKYLGAMTTTWVWAFDQWKRLRDYHAERGSPRHYAEITKGPPPQGIQPGDIVLKDVSFGMDPDHITTAVSFDGRYLVTVGGNEGGKQRDDETGVQRSKGIDLSANPDPNDARLIEDGKRVRKADPDVTKNKRVHGIGRWSICDYETHHYVISAKEPTKPPSATALQKLG